MRTATLSLMVLMLSVTGLFAGIENTRNYIEGKNHFLHGNYDDALRYFTQATKQDEPNPAYFYWMGKTLVALQRWEEAYDALEVFALTNQGPQTAEAIAMMEIISRDFDRVSDMQYTGALEILPAYVNSRNSDYSPVFNNDGTMMYFTSKRVVDRFGDTGKEDIYRVKKAGFLWGEPELVKDLSTDKNECFGSLVENGTRAYMSGNYSEGSLNSDIYMAKLTGEGWSVPVPVPGINTLDPEMHPYSYRDSVMFFTSMRQDGIGGLDLYVSENIGGSWSRPQNLGKVINTQMDETTPFLDWDGKTLYFASNGHNGLGGMDIFKAVLTGPTWQDWSTPENIGLIANSVRNERYFYRTEGSDIAFISSDRWGGYGYEDLYSWTIVKPKTPEELAKEAEAARLAAGETGELDNFPVRIYGTILDEDENPVQTTVIFTYTTDKAVLSATAQTDEYGEYEVGVEEAPVYQYAVQQPGYHFLEDEVKRARNVTEIENNITLKLVKKGVSFEIQNIYFDFNKATLKPESQPELNKVAEFLLNNASWKVEISGHTCNIGSYDYNKKLSTKRAQAVVDDLSGKGVARERMVAEGYSFDKPVADNKTEEGRQKNRRVEMKPLGDGEVVMAKDKKPAKKTEEADSKAATSIMYEQITKKLRDLYKECEEKPGAEINFDLVIGGSGNVEAVSVDVVSGKPSDKFMEKAKTYLMNWSVKPGDAKMIGLTLKF